MTKKKYAWKEKICMTAEYLVVPLWKQNKPFLVVGSDKDG